MLRKFLKNKNQKGATLIEYAILCGVMVTAAVLMLGSFKNQASNAFNTVGLKLNSAAEGNAAEGNAAEGNAAEGN